MTPPTETTEPDASARPRARALPLLATAAILLGALARVAVVAWNDPWTPHHPDEHILAVEAMALWEGVTPREVGWPGTTTRLVLSAIEGGELLAQEGSVLWQERGSPDRALAVVTKWIGARYIDQTPLYRTGRLVSVSIGILQLIAVAWALHQWVGPRGVAAGTLAAALAPSAVAYSQYVLADMTGVLFATLVVGLAARPTRARIIAMSALAGLAAASKFHYGLWLLTPILCIWLRRSVDDERKSLLTLAALGVAAWVLVTLVPWIWLNPVVPLKEFLATVADKVGTEASWRLVPDNVGAIFGGLGALSLVGAIAGLFGIRRERWAETAPVVVPVIIGTFVLGVAEIVFDRYGLVLLPGLVLFAGFAADRWLGPDRRRPWPVAEIVLAVCLIATIVALSRSQGAIRETDVDVLVARWVQAHVSPGVRVALHDESNAFLPRTAGQLQECTEQGEGPAAYRDKWRVLGVQALGDSAQPMRSAVLVDEIFRAYLCRRELQAQQGQGYVALRYHTELRFAAFLERDVTDEFRTGGRRVTGGVDVLVLNRPVDVGMPPAQVFETRRGLRAIYVR